jgi:hypothetical protein
MKHPIRSIVALAVAAPVCVLATSASAQITWTSTPTATPAPTYANTLNFDEAPLPAGVPGPIAANAYASRGVSSISSNDAVSVGNGNALTGWTFFPTGNQAVASSFISVQFAYDITAFSVQFWESAPNFNPINGGGARIDLLDNGNVVGQLFINNPFWQSNTGVIATLPTWFNAVAANGVVFDRVDFNGFGNPFGSDMAAIDNLSWVPSPGAAALLGIGGLFAGRRRR